MSSPLAQLAQLATMKQGIPKEKECTGSERIELPGALAGRTCPATLSEIQAWSASIDSKQQEMPCALAGELMVRHAHDRSWTRASCIIDQAEARLTVHAGDPPASFAIPLLECSTIGIADARCGRANAFALTPFASASLARLPRTIWFSCEDVDQRDRWVRAIRRLAYPPTTVHFDRDDDRLTSTAPTRRGELVLDVSIAILSERSTLVDSGRLFLCDNALAIGVLGRAGRIELGDLFDLDAIWCRANSKCDIDGECCEFQVGLLSDAGVPDVTYVARCTADRDRIVDAIAIRLNRSSSSASEYGARHLRCRGTLHSMSYMGEALLLERALQDPSCLASINGVDCDGCTPLHLASWGGRIACTTVLIRDGAARDLCNSAGDTPLHLACKRADADTVRLLLEPPCPASCQRCDAAGRSPLWICLFASGVPSIACARFVLPHCCGDDIATALKEAAARDLSLVVHLLLQAPNTPTPAPLDAALHAAVQAGATSACSTLLALGAPPNRPDARGRTPLVRAELHRDEVIAVLAKFGARGVGMREMSPRRIAVSVAGQYDAHYRFMLDSETSSCPTCARRFAVARRRHHCRRCGRLACDRCSRHRMVVLRSGTTGGVKRICDPCYNVLSANGAHEQGAKDDYEAPVQTAA